MTRKQTTKFVVCLSVLLAFSGLGLWTHLRAGSGFGTLLRTEAMEGLLGGGCAYTECGADTCSTTGCAYTVTTCQIVTRNGQRVCGQITSSPPGEICNNPPGKDGAYNCEQKTATDKNGNPIPCNQYYEGAITVYGGCKTSPTTYVCAATGSYCGSYIHTCTQTACQEGE